MLLNSAMDRQLSLSSPPLDIFLFNPPPFKRVGPLSSFWLSANYIIGRSMSLQQKHILCKRVKLLLLYHARCAAAPLALLPYTKGGGYGQTSSSAWPSSVSQNCAGDRSTLLKSFQRVRISSELISSPACVEIIRSTKTPSLRRKSFENFLRVASLATGLPGWSLGTRRYLRMKQTP